LQGSAVRDRQLTLSEREQTMTENQWTQPDPSASVNQYGTAGTAAGSGGAGTAAGSGGAGGTSSKSEAAKEEAADVAGQAAGAAQTVAETAKAEAANVASEVKTNARDLLQKAKSDLTNQAGTQQQKVAEGLRSISGELENMANASDQPGVASELIRQAAERSKAVASWLDNRDPGSLLDEVQSIARRRPGVFLLVAAGAGVLAGRLGKSLQAGAPASATTTGTGLPPQPVPAPATGSGITAGIGEPFYEETTLGEPPRTGTGPSYPPTVAGGASAGVPLRDADDPYAQGEGRRL
jgi:cell division septum initiation protein DivIVA